MRARVCVCVCVCVCVWVTCHLTPVEARGQLWSWYPHYTFRVFCRSNSSKPEPQPRSPNLNWMQSCMSTPPLRGHRAGINKAVLPYLPSATRSIPWLPLTSKCVQAVHWASCCLTGKNHGWAGCPLASGAFYLQIFFTLALAASSRMISHGCQTLTPVFTLKFGLSNPLLPWCLSVIFKPVLKNLGWIGLLGRELCNWK